MKRKETYNLKSTVLIALYLFIIVACTNESDDEKGEIFNYPELVELTELTELTRIENVNNQLFGSPSIVVPLLDNKFIIGDTQDLKLHLFDANFNYLHSFGRSGEGPGEFQRFSNIDEISEGSIKVYDGRSSIVSEIEVNNNMLSLSKSTEFTYHMHPNHPAAMFWKFVENQEGENFALYYDFNITEENPLIYHKIVAFSYSSEYEPKENDPIIVFDEHNPEVKYEGGILNIPFLRRGYINHSKGNLLYAMNDKPEVLTFDQNGDTLDVLKLPDTSIELTREQKIEAFEGMYANSSDPERFRSTVMQYIPNRRPIIRALQVDADHRLWVRIYPVEGQADWIVFTEKGDPLFEINIPDGMTFRNASGNRIYTQRNTDEGPEIIVHQINESF